MTSPAPALGDEPMMRLTRLESLSEPGIGEWDQAPPLPPAGPGLDPVEALEEALLPALQRPPCLVMFSGGRDSSAVLALACRVARREGLALPIPTTQVFPDFPETDETDAQELMIRHLGIEDWHRRVHGTELNMLGPAAQRLLRRHGLLAPPGTHVLSPVLEDAGQGSVMTGIDGDGLFAGGEFGLARDLLARRAPADSRTLRNLGRSVLPPPLGARWQRFRSPTRFPWLRPDAEREALLAIAADAASEPLRWDRRVRWWARRRYVVAVRQSLEFTARDFPAMFVQPLFDRRFLAAVASWGGALGKGDREATMRALFSDLLPPETIARTHKALFTKPYWGGETQEFIASWDGQGVPEDLVDVDSLREAWAEAYPDVRTGVLLQAAWLSVAVGQPKEPVNCQVH